MALTESTMLPIGTKAPNFKLLDTLSNDHITFDSIRGENGTVVLFICNHCPYVIHVNQELIRIAHEYKTLGIGFVAISSNDIVKYPQDGPEAMAMVGKVLQYPFPYLFDETQEIAKIYDAACTPDIYIFDSNDLLFYRGRLDESRPNNGKALNGKDVRLSLELMLRGENPLLKQYPSAGCNIKWK